MEVCESLVDQLVSWKQDLLDASTEEKLIAKNPGFLLAVLDSINESDSVQNVTIGLSRIIWKFPVAARFAEEYFSSHGSPLESIGTRMQSLQIEDSGRKKRKYRAISSVADLDDRYLVKLLTALLVILRKLPLHIFVSWNITDFMNLKSRASNKLRWLAAQCLAKLLDLSDIEVHKLTEHQFALNAEERVVESVAFETETTTYYTTPASVSNLVATHFPVNEITQVSPELDLLSLGGIVVKSVRKLNPSEPQPFETLNVVPLPSVIDNVKKILLQVQRGIPVCVSGPMGVGKTSLLRFTSSVCGRNDYPSVISVQMSDQIDSRMLLGAYHSTDLPGQFVWKPGCLTKAILNGYWIIFEDLDSAPMDVITLLDAVSEAKQVIVPGYGQISKFHQDFRMFATIRTSGSSGTKRQTDKCNKSWVNVHLNGFSSDELNIVVENLFPSLKPIVERIVQIYLSMKTTVMSNKRTFSVRDLIKLCYRLPTNLDFASPNSAVTIFHEACDVFVAPLSSFVEKMSLAQIIGAHLNILSSKVEYFLTMNKPQFQICGNANKVVAGRFAVDIFEQLPAYKREEIGVYSLTKRACTLLEMIAGAVKNEEPVLLIGETGVGKTSSIQYLAKVLHQKMIVVNLNRQSDSSDLLGGYKPVELKYIFAPLREEFETLFAVTFDKEANSKFMNHIMTCFANRRWKDLLKLMIHVQKQALAKQFKQMDVLERWKSLANQLSRLNSQVNDGSESPFAFAFIEGALIDAIKNGHWILLDEINLATSEMLQCLAGILEKVSKIHLWEKGDDKPIERHPNFHLFAAMNPSTDIGKKDLPVGIRNRFTEIFVDELTDEDELRVLVKDYLPELALTNEQICHIVEFYMKIKQLANNVLIDGMGKRPHFSLRTLCRALKISSFNLYGSVKRSLYESFCLSFLTQLDYSSHPVVQQLVAKYMCGKIEMKALLRHALPQPQSHPTIQVTDYWLPKGNKDPHTSAKYIITPSVKRNMRDLARVISAGKLPILIQGETSVGKTSLIQYLADATGNTCYRINNHQHTDLQEYIGSYQSDANGRLVFTEGVLVQAMRRGEWIILDELNLAPSEVLEALNRLLDDNRQLLITETGVTVTAHPRFMLFATQNPPGLYGGRKLLSRAFRNRFVELHFDEIPTSELETILHSRCAIPQSYCKKIIGVLKELQTRRKSSAALQGKNSFATLRDLFRWAERYRLSGQQDSRFYDWDQHLADEGFLVLAGKSRKAAEVQVIQDVLKQYMKRTVDPKNLFNLHENTSTVTKDILTQVINTNLPGFNHIVWTYPMRKLAVLVGSALKFKEPVLLVGDTGAGKTSVVQLLSVIYKCKLFSVNCHMHSESSDFLGGLRPVRNPDEKEQKLFEWVDGPLVEAMESGGVFLADEISLADDSVLERLNSVLEPERTLLVAEKGDEKPKLVVGHQNFHFIGTMNPGGDFGKKELSPALRNRLTEIWCESTTDFKDLEQIIEHNLADGLKNKGLSNVMVSLVQWLKNNELGSRCTVSIRDYLSWVSFVNHMTDEKRTNALDVSMALEHGACLAFLDGLGVGNAATELNTSLIRQSAIKFLRTLIRNIEEGENKVSEQRTLSFKSTTHELQLGAFTLGRNQNSTEAVKESVSFTLESPTTKLNALRLFRALQLNKPILLEGSPGQGKTALVTALAKATSFPLTRINLSEQTDIADLFGTDLPVEGTEGGHFAWRDGPLLQALKDQAWILLDELNLASQSVLEGLNACLDHRGEIFVPELNKTFKIHDGSKSRPCTRIFACQNPLRQGGARKGLPKSFLNRFTQVYVDSLAKDDMDFIICSLWPALGSDLVKVMTSFATELHTAVCINVQFGAKGGPWDFNLRDLLRWAEITHKDCQQATAKLHPELFVDLIYGLRMRSPEDRRRVMELFRDVWTRLNEDDTCWGALEWGREDVQMFSEKVVCGRSSIARGETSDETNAETSSLLVLRKDLAVLEATIACLNIGWMPILVGGSGTGKTSVVKLLAKLCGKNLDIMSPSPEMDTIDLLGGFEQADIYRKIDETSGDVASLLVRFVKKIVLFPDSADGRERMEGKRPRRAEKTAVRADFDDGQLVDLWKNVKQLGHLTPDGSLGQEEEVKRIEDRLQVLENAYLNCKAYFEGAYTTGMDHKQKNEMANGKHHLERVARDLKQIRSHLKAGVQTGSFQWIDSVLIKALVAGNWLLIDGANRCSAAVLDRLNSLMEPNGSLFLSERGSIDGKIVEIKPHPNFRLILAMDPAHGEISRAMRNRGVEIFMSNSPVNLTDFSESSQRTEVEQNVNGVAGREVTLPGIRNDTYPHAVTSEFGISIFDLDDMLKLEGIHSPKLRAAVLNLHREIHQISSSNWALDSRFSRMLSIWRQIAVQIENGIDFREAMCAAFTSAYVEDCDLLGPSSVINDASRKVEMDQLITRYCRGLDESMFKDEDQRQMPIRIGDGSAESYRIWKSIQVISNALCETSWSQHEEWRATGRRKLVEDFLIVSVFSSVMKTPQDIGGLFLAVSNLHPVKSNFAKKLTNVLETTCSSSSSSQLESFMSTYNYGDIQRVAHELVKLADAGEDQVGRVLDTHMKLSLKLHAENEIFQLEKVTSSLAKTCLGFAAKNVKKTDSGNLFEFLYGFWQIITKYENLVSSCLSSEFSERRIDTEKLSSSGIVAHYSHVWLNGMKLVLWRKWLMELIEKEFNLKRPSEKTKSNAALFVQWLGEEAVPALDAIKRGIDSDATSEQAGELAALVEKCLEPLDHCGNRMLLERNSSFRSFYGIRPFLPTDPRNVIDSALSMCLKYWMVSAPVEPTTIAVILTSCSNGNGAEAAHRMLSRICEAILKLDSSQISLEQAAFLEKLAGSFVETVENKRRHFPLEGENETVSGGDIAVKETTKMVDCIQDFLGLLCIPPSPSDKYSVFVSPLLQALGRECSTQLEYLHSVLLWEDRERFRQYYTDSPAWISLKASCLLPYFTSKIILDPESHLIRSTSLGHREIISGHYKTLNRHLSQEILRPRNTWESASGLVKQACQDFVGLVVKWEMVLKMKGANCGGLQQWKEKLNRIFMTDKCGPQEMGELGCLIVEVSCFIMEITTYLPIVDPSVEAEIRMKCKSDEIEYFSAWTTAQRVFSQYTTGHDIFSSNGTSSDLQHVHPYLGDTLKLLESSSKDMENAKSSIAARPEPPQYEALRQDAIQFVKTMASKSKIDELTSRVRNLFSKLGQLDVESEITENEINAVLIPCSSWLESCANFVHKQLKRFWYWDISLAYIHPAIQAISGFSLVCHAVRKIAVKRRAHEKSTVLELLQFPNDHTPKVSDASGIYDEPWAYKRATKKLLISSLLKFYNKLISLDCITPNQIKDLHEFTNEVSRIWKEQQEEKQRQKEIDDAMYVYKGKEKNMTDGSDEETENIANLFPDFTGDFQDISEDISTASFDGPRSDQRDICSTSANDVEILESDDIDVFLKVHSLALSHIQNHCLKNNATEEASYDFETPFECLFEIGCYAFQSAYLDYDKEDESSLLMSTNLMVTRLGSASSPTLTVEDKTAKVYDVYRDPNVAEVIQAGPVITAMRSKILALLKEWEEQPALLRILEVLDRIESFDVKSPLIKFLAGLEMLLSVADEWEKVAHRGVSIAANIMEVSNLVISWRKLELKYWKNLLQVHWAREQKEAKQWWFHLFASSLEFSVENYENDLEKKKKFIKLLRQFMESSCIGQFATRLDLLEQLHRHFTGLVQTSQAFDSQTKNSFVVIVKYIWNAVVYYRQFVPAVSTQLKSLSAPIEKKIKDFIKICRWNDANLYALRDSVKKSQKMLSKLVTEYKKVLLTPVSTVLIADTTEGLESKKKKEKSKPTQTGRYIMQQSWTDNCPLEKLSLEKLGFGGWTQRLSKLAKHYEKSRKISQDTMKKDEEYYSQIVELDDLTGGIIDRVRELQNLEVPEEKGDKRKKALHHVHNLRRKSLAELFKALQDLGLSFRRGLIYLKGLSSETEFCDFDCEPTDLTIGWENLPCRFPADSELMEAWNGCENYFQKCISRIAVLLQAFHNPSKELGPNIIDRCKGYAIDLLQHAVLEKDAIGKQSKLLWELRMLVNMPQGRDDENQLSDTFAQMIYAKASDLETEYNQYLLVAESLAEQDGVNLTKSAIKKTCQSVVSHVGVIKSKLHRTVSSTTVRDLTSGFVSEESLLECCEEMKKIVNCMAEARGTICGSSILACSLSRSQETCNTWLLNFEKSISSEQVVTESTADEEKRFCVAVEKTLKAILLSFQHLDTACKETGSSSDIKVTESLLVKRMECIDTSTVVENVLKIRHVLNTSGGQLFKERYAIVKSMIPLLYQFCFAQQFYLKLLAQQHRTVTKLLSVLSGVFTTLAQKGFCLPEDYEKDAVEEGPEMDEKSGMGLGEGETTSDAKDVSDRIESEDQLDDTLKAGEKVESADKDVGEDEKGVEMSDDFEGKQQDKEDKKGDNEKDNESSADEEEKEELDQEMGNVDPDGEKIDDKMWGGSSDEEDDEGEDQEKESGKGSKEKMETELASKPNEEKEDNQESESGEPDRQNKEFNEDDDADEPNDDQVDPYHGENRPEEEPEAMDLPEDLQLDDADAKDEKEGPEENPFDLDAAERELPPGFDEEEEKSEEIEDGEKPAEMSEDENEGPDINVEATQQELEDNNEENTNEQENGAMEIDPTDEEDGEKTEPEKEAVDTTASGDKTNDESQETPEPSSIPTPQSDDKRSSAEEDKQRESVTAQEEENPAKSDDQAAGQVESKDGFGHEGKTVNKEKQQSSEMQKDSDDASRRPGETDSKRSLADQSENMKDQLKRLKTTDKSQGDVDPEPMEEDKDDDSLKNNAELYQHIQDAEKKDSLTIDNATKEQLDKQRGMQMDDNSEKTENPRIDDGDDEEMEVDDTEELTEAELEKQKPDLIRGLPENKKKAKNKTKTPEENQDPEKFEIEGEQIPTLGAQRPADSYSHTNLELLKKSEVVLMDSEETPIDLAVDPLSVSGIEGGALVEWHDLEAKTLSLSQELCEQLRLILEPTQAARLKGDYKTGKRLNMRKVIPYIASGFRKDKIWLRRTQPSKREYQILLALDDSASMLDNKSKQIAFSAVAVVARALTLLEAGKLAVASFGEDFNLVHGFDEPFTDMSGAKIMKKFTFAQQRTRIPQLMNHAGALFTQARASGASSSLSPEVAQLMIIISDGRGINNEGMEATKTSIMKAREKNIFIVFIIVDNPDNKNSILDIRQPLFGPDNSVQILRYMDNFPFPFYLILRDIQALPTVLSDALRQWFELVTSGDR